MESPFKDFSLILVYDFSLWNKKGLKYLGVYLGNNEMFQENWEGFLEKVQDRPDKWKWLLPKLSYRGRTLIMNSPVASALWHRLACVDPPAGFWKIAVNSGELLLGRTALGSTKCFCSSKLKKEDKD